MADTGTREQQVREELRAWIGANWDEELTLREWWRRLGDSGWGFPTWPEERHGKGLPKEYGTIVGEELLAANVVGPPRGLGTTMGGPVVIDHGDDDQRRRYVGPLARGEESWCQFFSEPEAGSDLAGLRTRAERDGDEWVVNGQKVWTSGARNADRGMLVCRTNWDVPKHRGLSYFIIDVDQPGIEIRPLKQMNHQAHFNEVFFTDARVPHANLIGEDGQGWAAAVGTLAYERAGSPVPASVVTPDPGRKWGNLDKTVGQLLREASSETSNEVDVRSSRFMISLAREFGRERDPVIREKLIELHTTDEVFRMNRLRAKASAEQGRRPGPEANISKLLRTIWMRQAAALGLELQGPHGMLMGADAPKHGVVQTMALTTPSSSIAGGSDEIQHNILGERALGLPKDISVDRDMPFREVRGSKG
jgi:alkylation response protein AidB-like acyl-CoA dehydrogenase